jgi:hypothetical protein
MDFRSGERPAAILGIAFAVWFMVQIYLVSSLNWRAAAVAVVIGAGILLVARAVRSKLA